ncbi:hypothetical protein M404DRAFT_993068 [Pisolithus tinctorius Marx 270]|uniref:6,7-dimethyl-8-ribityllumazine synthase n=1 Tax=Pisolithus tinctorius Marx 270 TaxID=870435 RepID=A0A0C3JWK0_PISTI|nr:hypothetical protein M404DRAFT_993068 [Pisolithus tinctorius Marx 270]
MSSIKGPATNEHDGSNLRIAIVHARWNKPVVDALVAGALAKLRLSGVEACNIVIQSVPGSFELPLACSRIITGSRIQSGGSSGDLLGFTSANPPSVADSALPSAPFDAVIAIGVLIKGATMHFEYISDSVSHALMKVQLDTGVPVIFGVLTALTEEQALERAGMGGGSNKGHNHGEDWGLAAVEMATHCRNWSQGRFIEET